MSDDTPHLKLPFLAEGQQSKSVTVNDALNRLDALVQIGVKDRDLAAPPAAPAEGDRYIVAAAGSGVWSGCDGQLAAFFDGAWTCFAPQEGWTVWVADETALLVYCAGAWRDWSAGLGALQNLTLLGVGTTADATNPFAAKLNGALWTAKAAAEGGSGDLRYVFNKEAAANTGSLLFQDGFSGRAEIGLTGDDNLHLKVSADGTAWKEALVIDPASGTVQGQRGSAAAPSRSYDGDKDTGTFSPGADAWAVAAGGTEHLRVDASGTLMSNGPLKVIDDTNTGQVFLTRTATTGAFAPTSYGSSFYLQVGGGEFGANSYRTIGLGYTLDGSYPPAHITYFETSASGSTYGDVIVGARGSASNTPAVNRLRVRGSDGGVMPCVDNAQELGDAAYRWATIYAATGTIATSDARDKTGVSGSALGLAFINALRPVSYQWKVGGVAVSEADDDPDTVLEQATETVTVSRTRIAVAGGKAVQTTEQVAEKRLLWDTVPVIDAAGQPVMAGGVQATHRAPRMVEVRRPKKKTLTTDRAGVRTHYGLLAQDVKAAVEAAGAGDFAGWTLDDPRDPDSRQGLRYDQFIAPLIKAVQELAARVDAISTGVGTAPSS